MGFDQVTAYMLSHFGNWTLGDLTIIDLIAATTNAFNSALLARRPDHFRNWSVVGILMMAIFGGIGGGVTRDVLLNQVPSALVNPWYLILSSLAGVLGVLFAYGLGRRFRKGLYQFMLSFSLPWYAVVGAQKGLDASLPLVGCVLLGVVGSTFGRFFIDITSMLPPEHFVRGEWNVGAAILASVVYLISAIAGMSIWAAMGIALLAGFAFRTSALSLRWMRPEPWDPEAEKEGEPSASRLAKASAEDSTTARADGESERK